MLPVAEEVLHVEKRQIEAGRVRVSVTTEAEERLVREVLRTERVDVERVPVGREIAADEEAPAIHRDADGVLVVPILEEVLVIEKRLVLREELRLRRVASEEPVEHACVVRRQHVQVERLEPGSTAAGSGTETHTTPMNNVDDAVR